MKPRHLIAALLCALLIAYPLSMAPVAKWHYRNHPRNTPGPHWAAVFYAPISWAANRSFGVSKAFNWYFRLWGLNLDVWGLNPDE